RSESRSLGVRSCIRSRQRRDRAEGGMQDLTPRSSPMTGLATLIQALAFITRDDLVEQTLFRPRVVQVMVDDVVPERSACHRPLLERVDRLTESRGKALRVRLVRVPLERRGQLEPLLDAV